MQNQKVKYLNIFLLCVCILGVIATIIFLTMYGEGAGGFKVFMRGLGLCLFVYYSVVYARRVMKGNRRQLEE